MRLFVLPGLFLWSFFSPFSHVLAEEVAPPQLPQFYLNGELQSPTVQDLSGIATRPLRLLVRKNNAAHGEELIQAYALGARAGDDLRIDLGLPSPGTRVTLYKILREVHGSRYLSMPVSIYHGEAKQTTHHEKIVPFREEFFIVVFEKTDSPNEKNVHVRYFEERVRSLVIAAFKTNLMLSSLKFKMKDFADEEAREFLEEDAQELVDKFIHPQRIFLIRLWKADSKKENQKLFDFSIENKTPSNA